MNRNSRNILILMCLFLFIISGCSDRQEIEQRSYVIGVGLDKADEDNMLKVTYLISNPEYGSLQQGGGESAPPKQIITFKATDFISSKEIANTVIPKHITYDLIENIFISEKLAKDKNLIRWMYDTTKDVEIRRDIKVIITKENPGKFLENSNPKFEVRPHKYFHLMIDRASEIGFIPPNSQLLQYFRILEAKGDLFLAIYATAEETKKSKSQGKSNNVLAGELDVTGEKNNTQFSGSAVFKKGIMIDKLNNEETQLSILLNNTLPAFDFMTTFPDPFDKNLDIAVKINSLQKNKIKFNLKNKPESIDAKISLSVEILTNHSMTDYNKKENRKILQKSIERELDKKFKKLIKKTQNEFKGEPFGWSLIARKKFLTLDAYRKFNWKETYPNMDVNVHTKAFILNYGRQKEVPKKKEVLQND